MAVKTQEIYYNLLLHGYMFRLLRVIIRPSNEPTSLGSRSAYSRCCNSIVSLCHNTITSVTGSQSALGIR